MSEDIDKRVLRKYEIREKLGKGVRTIASLAHHMRIRDTANAVLIVPCQFYSP